MSIRILLVDDHQMFRDGLKAFLQTETEIVVVGEASNGKKAVDLCLELVPDVVVMDISMPEMSGIEATKIIHADAPATKVIILTMHTEKRFVLGALKAGASGIAVKNNTAAELLTAIKTVMSGQTYLSPTVSDILVKNLIESGEHQEEKVMTTRERQILELIATGKCAKVIGTV
jgi:DNA-binding NarL/FixJ family response regulator